MARPAGRRAQDAGLATILNFESEPNGKIPRGWKSNPGWTVSLDDKIVHGGRRAARLDSTSDPKDLSSLYRSLPINFTGKTIELRAFLRTEKITGAVNLFL